MLSKEIFSYKKKICEGVTVLFLVLYAIENIHVRNFLDEQSTHMRHGSDTIGKSTIYSRSWYFK